jgi:hypothetical protein
MPQVVRQLGRFAIADSDGAAVPGPTTSESAATYAWLEASLGLLGTSPDLATRLWADVRDRMRNRADVQQNFVYTTDWPSDYWIAKGARTSIWTFAATWDPPEGLSAWPSFDIERLVASGFPGTVARTAYSPPPAAASDELGTRDSADAALQFIAMESEIERHGDPTMVHGEHVRAWLKCAVGDFLMALLLSPEADEELLRNETVSRLSTPLNVDLPGPLWLAANEFEEKTLEVLYNLQVGDDGQVLPPDWPNIRVGQGEGWRQSWDWLSVDVDLSVMRHAIRTAARIMRCTPVVQALVAAAGLAESRLSVIALAVVRRWLLTLRVMHWLEAATDSNWRDVRPQDLACFAFSAVKPEWPRRVLAVSHRSPDAKPTLRATSLWWSGLCALDASYVPAWETNTGMVWSLFGACPMISRLASDRYADSVWCRRESELSQYLRDHSDFMAGRWLIDVPLADVSALDKAFVTWRGQSEESFSPLPQGGGRFREFPPACTVWTPTALPAWETKLLRASAALRTINDHVAAAGGDATLTNTIAEFLTRGILPPPDFSAPTNNPDGWLAYAAIFQELVNACGLDPHELPIRLPDDYTIEARPIDADLVTRVPDLSSGVPALGDCLVALEFFRTWWPLMVEERYGTFLAINCRDINRDEWTSAEQLSLHRGLLSVRAPVPVWIIQNAGQQVENWGLPGDRPIFTEYLPDQFTWMDEAFLDQRGMQARFPADSGLQFSTALRTVCEASGPGPERAGSSH